MMSAPLMAGNDLTLENDTLGLLTNREVIEIDQDPLHFGASEIALKPGAQTGTHVLAKPLSRSGARAVALLNEGNSDTRIRVNFADSASRNRPSPSGMSGHTKTWVSCPHPMRQRSHRMARVCWKSRGENLRYQAWCV
jgi:hypothetical protein